MTFTLSNWNQPQTITLSAVNDTTHEDTLVITISHSVTSADSNFAALTPSDVSVTVIDNDPASAPTSLPIEFGGPWNEMPTGFVGSGLGSPYGSSLGGDSDIGSARFDNTGDRLVVSFDEAPSTLSYHLKGNPANGTATAGTFVIQQSPDGVNYTNLLTVINKDNTDQPYSHLLSTVTRFVLFTYQENHPARFVDQLGSPENFTC